MVGVVDIFNCSECLSEFQEANELRNRRLQDLMARR